MTPRCTIASVAAVAALFAAPANARQQPTDAKSAGTATVRGRITEAATGKPLRRARVNLAPAEFTPNTPLENRATSTDADGKYEFTAVIAGRYVVNVQKSGFASWQFGQTRPREAGKPIQLGDKETIERVDVALPSGAVIAGRVVDEFGDPVIDATVSLMRATNMGGVPRLSPFGSANTNDEGEFRLASPQPGQYFVAATARAMQLPPDIPERIGWARTFYPSTADASGARRLNLAMGTLVSDLVIQLIPIRPSKISGTATSSQGKPLTGSVNAMRRGDFGAPSAFGPIRPDGTFEINGVAPGDYTLTVSGPPSADGETASIDVTVGAEDVDGVTLIATRPLIAAGHIVADPALINTLRPSSLRVTANPAPVNGTVMFFGPQPGPGAVAEDLTFEVKTRPGRMRLNVMNLPSGVSVRAVRQGSNDVTDTGVEFRPGAPVNDLEIELTNLTTTLSGSVTTNRGEPTADYTVVAFSQDRERWASFGRYTRTSRPNQYGQYAIKGLPPGDYFIAALPSVDFEESQDPEFLEQATRVAARISLNEGEAKAVDLRLAAAPR